MAESRLPPMEEARVRTAALVAAQRMNWTVPRAVLDYIIATSDPRQAPAALEMRAAGIVEYVRSHPSTPDLANASDREAQSFFRMIHGQVVSRFGGLPWALALAREEEASDRGSGSAAYAELGGDLGSITPSNFKRSHYHRCGLDYATFDALRREGFSGQNIINAASDARALGFSPRDREAMRDHALIDKHSIDPRGMNQAMQDYQRRAREDAELNALLRRRMAANLTEDEKRALDEQIRTRREEHMRATGLQGRIENPQEDARAREAGQRRKDAIDTQQEELLRLSPHLTEEEIAQVHQRQTVGVTAIDQTWAAELAKRDVQTDEAEDAALVALAGVTAPSPTTGAPTPTTPPPATVQRAETTATPPPTQTAVATPPRPSGQTLQA
jgi:hypothetical protein